MATVKFRWTVDEIANVRTLFDVQRVWRSAAATGPWAELTAIGTRVVLVAGQSSYYYDDTAAVAGYYYAVSYYNSLTAAESNKSDPVRIDSLGYLTIEEMRAEGITETMATDAQIANGIQRATAMIDQVTGQWFEPRTRTFRLDARRGVDLLLQVPIIALTEARVFDEVISMDSLWVYNRHLTQGLTNPDDRVNPRIGWREDDLPREYLQYEFERRFQPGFGTIVLTGVFGYTELDRLDVPGETAPGSQVPVSYGNTPLLINLACRRLAYKYLFPLLSDQGDDLGNRFRLVEVKTRDQSMRFSEDMSAYDMAYGMTGDREVDGILLRFLAPVAIGAL